MLVTRTQEKAPAAFICWGPMGAKDSEGAREGVGVECDPGCPQSSPARHRPHGVQSRGRSDLSEEHGQVLALLAGPHTPSGTTVAAARDFVPAGSAGALSAPAPLMVTSRRRLRRVLSLQHWETTSFLLVKEPASGSLS